MQRRLALSLLLALATPFAGCANPPADLNGDDLPFTKVEPGKEDSSAEAVFLEFSFDAELHTTSRWNANSAIEDQLLYTMGQLNGVNGVARLDHLRLSDVETVSAEGGGYTVRYHAVLPVAWGRRTQVPAEFDVRLPRDMSYEGVTRFAETYGHSCVDSGAHDVDSGSMWYYFRPARSGCSLAEADILTTVADVTLSEINTTGRFPEYDMVWSDDALRVVAVFGKYEDGATTSSDAGVAGYHTFLREIRRTLGDSQLTTVPADVPSSPGVSVPEVEFHATLNDGRTVEVVAILVDNVRTAGAAFDRRYAQLSRNADLIVYNGHAGLGANVRALAQKGDWQAGQYAIVFMNGCDTYAYVDSALWDSHSAVNPDDPAGTRYLDIVMNAMPSYFSSMPRATLALVNGLLSYDEPRTYEQIFANVDRQQIVLVSGEQDNAYTPGGGDEPPTMAWEGMMEAGELTRGAETRFSTPTLPAGTYHFEMNGTGDADLYVRIGSEPTQAAYDCRPYKSSSDETCEVQLASDAPIHVMVRGYRDASFSLSASTR
ncbi:MAG: pre-peptidase C-terminal domain-containing protein [Sandaracinaceae bacterium]